MSIVDLKQRAAALNPQQSFCVSAPAGSGKTELLIQRYLTLLGRVSRPEQVLAITFTRKAAAEMRERVLEALVGARDDEPCDSAHQQTTRMLALAALKINARENWQLVESVSRLNIKTIDSFCSQLTRQMPVLSEFGGQAEVVDNASELYAEAVSELFKLIDTPSPLSEDLAQLMLHFDNDWGRLQELLTSMLARRDQWRVYIGVHGEADEAESYLLHTVNTIVEEALDKLHAMLGPYSEDILALQQYALGNLGETVPDRSPGPVSSDLPLWRDIRRMLLTAAKNGSWRARVDVRMGFPPGKGVAQERKDQLSKLIGEIAEIEGLQDAINAVMTLPEMEISSKSWQLVVHLSRILPRLAAELLLVFQRHGRVDHSQVSLSALQAIGEDDTPTELALRLDYQLEHILVDEFQDTAINQYELVRRLTRGWGEHNEQNPIQPRTLMIVGDGMQSIYGFRDANVGLFLRARKEGFNGVELEPLSLRSNFRSDERLVAWVNDTFADAFPAEEDVSKGRIRFTSASAVRSSGKLPAVLMQGFQGEQAQQLEVDAICEEVKRGIEDGDCSSIAVLARTRGHLQPILARFKALGIVYSAQDIDSLGKSSAIVDLMSLCRALSNPADRVAWLAILRAPWCGLTLADLHALGTAGEVPGYASVRGLLNSVEVLQSLSEDGRERAAHLATALNRAESKRDRLSLRDWIEQLWLELGGPGALSSDNQLLDAERFFQLLEQAEFEGVGLATKWLDTKLEKLYVQAENPSSKVQVMTLHKAKGLEFDWVIIPGLHRPPRANAKPLLLWDEHSSSNNTQAFLLAADDHSNSDEPTLYNWLKVQRDNKELLETTRLLYVGVTRAVQRLFLSAWVGYDEKKDEYKAPAGRSMLASIWPHFSDQMNVGESPTTTLPADEVINTRVLYRLRHLDRPQNPAPESIPRSENAALGGNIPPRRLNRIDRYVGTVVHLALEQLSRVAELPEKLLDSDSERWRGELAKLGLFGDALESAWGRVNSSIASVLADREGRWVLSSSHAYAESELPLTRLTEDGKIVDIIIDRTFVDGETNIRWVVDYKNSRPEDGEAREVFVQREVYNYRAQLEGYRDAMSVYVDEKVQCALYFTALGYMHPVEL